MPSEEIHIMKESKARFEGVIFNQTADLGSDKSTSCKVIDEATGEVIAQSGGGGGESDVEIVEVAFSRDESIEAGDAINLMGAFCQSFAADNNFSTGWSDVPADGRTIKIAMYKGIAIIDMDSAGLIFTDVTGDVTIDEHSTGRTLVVRGAGSAKISLAV